MVIPWRRAIRMLLAAGLVVGVGACGSDDNKDAATTSSSAAPDSSTTAASGGSAGDTVAAGIVIEQFKYTAGPVAAGSTVTVTNKDQVPHTVTSDDGKFDTKDVTGTASFTAPSEPGSYTFHCTIHGMTGSLTVT